MADTPDRGGPPTGAKSRSEPRALRPPRREATGARVPGAAVTADTPAPHQPPPPRPTRPGPARDARARAPVHPSRSRPPCARPRGVGGGVLKGADARRDSPARGGTGCHGARSLGPARGILGCAKPQLRRGTAKAPRPRGLGGATGLGPPGARGGGGGGRRGRGGAPKPPRRLLIFCFLPPFGLQRQLLQPQTRGRRRHRAA